MYFLKVYCNFLVQRLRQIAESLGDKPTIAVEGLQSPHAQSPLSLFPQGYIPQNHLFSLGRFAIG